MEDTREPETKKARMSEALDPLANLHSDVFELIFQHFNNRDVLNSSVVSPSWFAATEASTKCAEKLRLKINVRNCDDNSDSRRNYFIAMHGEIRSQRKYQNISVANISCYAVQEIGKILTGRHWKKISFTAGKLCECDWYHLLNRIEGDVEELQLIRIHFMLPLQALGRRMFVFPKLTKLHMEDSTLWLAARVFNNCRSLKVLRMWFNTAFVERKYLPLILSNNNQLEQLQLLICEPVVDSRAIVLSKLKTLIMREVTMQQSLDFLKHQAGSLEKLRILTWPGFETLALVLKMPKLTDLGLNTHHAELINFEEFVQLKINSTITQLTIGNCCNFDPPQARLFNVLFFAMPNLRFLVINFLNDQSLNVIGLQCRNLEEIIIRRDLSIETGVDNPVYFPNIKRLKFVNEINGALRQRIEMKARDQRTPFEQLLLDTVPGKGCQCVL